MKKLLADHELRYLREIMIRRRLGPATFGSNWSIHRGYEIRFADIRDDRSFLLEPDVTTDHKYIWYLA